MGDKLNPASVSGTDRTRHFHHPRFELLQEDLGKLSGELAIATNCGKEGALVQHPVYECSLVFVQLFHDPLEAARTHAVRELEIGVRGDVSLDLLPIVGLVSDHLAIRADREKSLQPRDVLERIFELDHAGSD